MNQIWLTSELFYPDEISTGYIMTQFAEHLAQNQLVNVICGPTGYEDKSNDSAKKLHKNIVIHRVKMPKLNKNKLASRIIRMLWLTFKMGWVILRKVKKGDRLILVTNPASLLVLVGLIHSFKHFDYSLIVHDVFPENLIAARLQKNTSFVYRFLLGIYNRSYNAADHLYVLGKDMQQLVAGKVKPNKKIDIIPNWAETAEIFPIKDFDKNEYLKINVKDKIVIGFAGNIGRTQGLADFMNLFIDADNPELAFVIIGEGAVKPKLQEIVRDRNGKNVYFLGNKPRKEQIQFLNACDIGLVSLCEGMYGLGVPSKTYNIMATGKPILYIGSKNSEVDLYVKRYDCGWSFDWSDQKELITFLSDLSLKDAGNLYQKGQHGYAAIQENFSRDKILTRFQTIFDGK